MKHPCQAIVIRLARDPASGEVLNIGVVLLAREHRFFEARFTPPSDMTNAVRRIVPDDDASLLLSSPVSGVTDHPARTLRGLFERYATLNEPSATPPPHNAEMP